MSLRFENVCKSFGSKQILGTHERGLSFEVSRGEIFFILGRSGTGKSVTLKCFVGMLTPEQGRVWVDQTCVSESDANAIAHVRKKCGMVFQFPALFDSLNVFENVAFGLRVQKLSEAETRRCVIKSLEDVNLDPSTSFLTKLPSEISYGEQKRVSIARTLALEPSYLLFDEPTTGLDPRNTRVIHELIVSLSRKLNVTIVVVSHDMRTALEFADRIVVLDQGHLLGEGTPKEISKSANPLIKDFLSESHL